MLGARHPFTHALYERDDDGNVVVTATDGTRGTFTKEGRWLHGDLREADCHLCGWVAGPMIGNHRMVETAPKH